MGKRLGDSTGVGNWAEKTKSIPYKRQFVREELLTFHDGVMVDGGTQPRMTDDIYWLNFYVMLSRATSLSRLLIMRSIWISCVVLSIQTEGSIKLWSGVEPMPVSSSSPKEDAQAGSLSGSAPGRRMQDPLYNPPESSQQLRGYDGNQ